MQTNYGKQLPVSRELKGTADIILADKNVSWKGCWLR